MGVIWPLMDMWTCRVVSNREVTIILSGDNYFGGGGDQVSKSHMRSGQEIDFWVNDTSIMRVGKQIRQNLMGTPMGEQGSCAKKPMAFAWMAS